MHEAELGGASRAVLRVVPLLEELGWRFTFWVPSGGGLEAVVRERGLSVTGAPRLVRYRWSTLRTSPGLTKRLLSVPGYLHRLYRWIRREAPGLVHINTLTALPEAMTARASGVPVLMHVHEMLGHGSKSAVAARLTRWSTDLVVAVSQSSASALARYGVDAAVVPNGVDVADAAPRPPRSAGRLVVGTLGTVSKRKGSDLFLAAARLVGRQEPGAQFRMVGPLADGPEEAWSRALVASARAEGITHSTSREAFSELSEWDLFVLPSRSDPFPLVVLEAMATGLPVVATAVDGITEQVTDDTGLLVQPEDVCALAEAIVELLRSPVRRAQMGTAARRRVDERFTLVRQAQGLDRLYSRAIEEPSRNRPEPPRPCAGGSTP